MPLFFYMLKTQHKLFRFTLLTTPAIGTWRIAHAEFAQLNNFPPRTELPWIKVMGTS